VQVDCVIQKAVSRDKEIQLPLVSILKKMYLFLRETKFEEESCFRTFPNDCCFVSTYFAAIALERFGYESIFWVLGNRKSTGSHVWGECKGTVFDLTSGQFSDSLSESLIYSKDLSPNIFHSSFTIGERGMFDDRFHHDEVYFKLLLTVDCFFSVIQAESESQVMPSSDLLLISMHPHLPPLILFLD